VTLYADTSFVLSARIEQDSNYGAAKAVAAK